MDMIKPDKITIPVDGVKRPVKALFVGVNGEPVKVWDKEQGIVDKALFYALVKAVRGVG